MIRSESHYSLCYFVTLGVPPDFYFNLELFECYFAWVEECSMWKTKHNVYTTKTFLDVHIYRTDIYPGIKTGILLGKQR